MNDLELKRRIEKALKEGNLALAQPDIDKLLETVNIYHQELEHQNLELRRVQNQLEESNARFASLFSDAPVGYLVCDDELVIHSANNAFCNMVNCHDKPEKMNFTRFIHPAAQDDFYLFFKKLQKTEIPVSFDLTLKDIYNKPSAVKLDVNIFHDNNTRFYRFTFSDINEKKQFESQLMEKEENLRTTLNSIGDAVIAVTPDGLISQMNPVAEKLTGWTLELATGKPMSEVFNAINTNTGKKIINPADRIFQTVNGFESINHARLISKNGEQYQIACSAAPIKNERDETYGVVFVFRDVTGEYLLRERNNHLNNLLLALKNINKLITTEKDKHKLIRKACELLVENRGYHGAWIALYDEHGKYETSVSAGIGDEFKNFESDLIKNEPALCLEVCHSKNGVIVIETPGVVCKSCPLVSKYKNRSALAIKLSYSNRFFGILSVSIPKELSKEDEELQLFEELAGDLSLALQNIELETIRINNEKELAENENLLRTILQTTAEGFWIINTNGNFTEVNESFCKMTGYTREEAKGLKIGDIDNLESAEDTEKRMERIISCGSEIFESVHRKKDGTLFPVEMSVTYIPINGGQFVCFSRDLTIRKKDAQRISIMAQMLNEAPASITIHDFEGRFHFINKATLKLHGYDNEKEFLNINLHELDVSESKQLIDERIKLILEKGEARFEVRHHRKDKTDFPLEVQVKLIEWEGKPAMLSIASDITERKEAEKALQESEERFRSLIENAPVSILLAQDGKYIFGNPASLELMGFNYVSELAGRNILDSIAPEYQEIVTRRIKNVEAGGKNPTIEKQIIRPDGTRVWSISTSVPVYIEGKLTAIIVSQDITARKKAEEELQKSEERFRLLSDMTLEGILLHKNGITRDLNPSLAQMLGVQREELIGCNFFEFINPDYHPMVNEKMNQDYVQPYEIEIIRKDGSYFFAEIEARSFISKNETWRVAAIRDITKRKKAEEALRLSEEKYRLLVQTASDSIFMVSEDGLLLDINDSALRSMGYEKTEILNKPLKTVDPNFTFKQFKDFWMNTPFYQTRIFESTHRKKDGTLVPVEISGQKYQIAGKTYYYGIARDITERKLAEQKIRESEDTYRNIFQNAQVGLFRSRLSDGKMLESNDQLAKMFGYKSREDFLADFFTTENYVDEGTREKLLDTLNHEGFLKNFEARFYRKDRTIVWISFSARVYYEKGWIEGVAEDITERKKIIQELKNSEQSYKNLQMLFRNMADIVPDMIWAKDIDKKYIFANHSVCFNLLCTDDNTEPIGKTDMYFASKQRNLHPENPLWHTFGEGCVDSDTTTIHAGETCQFDEFGYVKGKFLFLDVIKTPIRNENGEITGVVGTARNVTESRKAHLRLLESEANLKAIIENSLDSIWSVNTSYEIQYVNETFIHEFQNSFGVKLKKGVNVIDSLPAEIQDIWKTRYERVLKNEHLLFQDIVDTGSFKVYIEVSMQPIQVDDKVVGVSVYGRNITEKINAEKEIQNAADRFRELIENAPDGVAIINASGKFIYASPNAIRHFGYTEAEVMETFGVTYTHPEDVALTESAIKKVLMNPLKKSMAIYRFKRKTGEYRWIETTFANLLDYEPIQGIVMNFSDITERKKLFEDLVEARDKAEESDRLKSAFLANMSHEIRTPMNGILGFTNLLNDSDITEEERKNYIHIIQKSGDRLLDTVNDLIDISKIETGQMKVFKNPTNIWETIFNLYNFFEFQASEKNLELKLNFELPESIAEIVTDKVKIDSILTNLIKNAIKFTDSGYIEIGCKIIKEEKNNSEHKSQEFIEFYVRDTGIGIPAEMQQSVFNRFEQVESGDVRAYQGSGLGLTIAKAYSEMLGGKIWLESEQGKGSVFYFTLPVLLAEENNTPAINLKSNTEVLIKELKQVKIVIAEDDDAGYVYLATLLKPLNAEIHRCSNGLCVVEFCRTNPDTDIILMDMRMPDLNGIEATRQIRKFNPNVVIIAQTAYALSGDKQNALDAGCNDYISKPIKRDELITMINSYINL
jgi:PAS domain S-box-containing protein